MKIWFATDRSTGCYYVREKIIEKYINREWIHEVRIDDQISFKINDNKEIIDVMADSLDWCDVMVLARTYKPLQDKSIKSRHKIPILLLRKAKELWKKVVYEIDDDFKTLFEGKALHNMSSVEIYNRWDKKEQIDCFYNESDLITTTTEELRQKLIPEKTVVLPNCIDFEEYGDFNFNKRWDKIKILVSGGITHLRDWQIILDPLKQLSKEFPIEIIFYGIDSNVLATTFKDYFQKMDRNNPLNQWMFSLFDFINKSQELGNITFVNWVEVKDYQKTLKSLGANIGLIPLEGTEFDESKSDIKFREYSACSIPVIASKVIPYSNNITEETGILCKNKFFNWYNAIKKLIENEDLAKRLALNAYNDTLKNRDISKNYKHWIDAYKNL